MESQVTSSRIAAQEVRTRIRKARTPVRTTRTSVRTTRASIRTTRTLLCTTRTSLRTMRTPVRMPRTSVCTARIPVCMVRTPVCTVRTVVCTARRATGYAERFHLRFAGYHFWRLTRHDLHRADWSVPSSHMANKTWVPDVQYCKSSKLQNCTPDTNLPRQRIPGTDSPRHTL